jgi:hypothetical protein
VNDYPSLSREAVGWLRYLHRKVRTADDWTKKGTPSEAWDARTSPPTLNWHRFDLTFASIAVAMMAEVTPAWREVYTEILDGLASRMTTYWAWHDWIEQRGEDPQRGSYPPAYLQLLIPPGFAGRYNVPGWAGNGLAPHPFEPDPVATSGALYYKGFFNFVLGLYEYVSGNHRYDEPFDLVYDDATRFTYDHPTIAETLARQWAERAEGIHCEVRKIWPMCSFLAGLGLRMYDVMHRMDRHWAFQGWYEHARRHYVSPVSAHPPEWLTLYYDPDTSVNFKTQDARAWLLTTLFLIPHDRRLGRWLYEGAKRRFFVEDAEGGAYFTTVSGCPGDDAFATAIGLALAHEIGDGIAYPRLRKWVEDHYQPVHDAEHGEFYFRFRLRDTLPRGQYNDLIMPAFVGAPGTWSDMFVGPNLAKFRQPTVQDIDFARVSLTQAYYDPSLRTLVVSIAPATRRAAGEETTFRVTALEAGTKYSVNIDGHAARRPKVVDGALEVRTTVADHTFTITAQ